jgi:hypothetical protein
VVTLVEIDPLVELAPSVHTVGDNGHAVGARDAGSKTADMVTVVAWAATSSAWTRALRSLTAEQVSRMILESSAKVGSRLVSFVLSSSPGIADTRLL